MSLELITFQFCPFGQRCLIALHEKGAAFETTFIDLANPPGWFAEVSPLKKVPVLRVHGKTIFDSAVINEYVDETMPPSLYSADALERALQRSWIAFSGELLTAQLAVFKAKSERSFKEHLDKLRDLMKKLGTAPLQGPFFGGERFSLVDAAYAPFFIRARLMQGTHIALGGTPPALSAWSDTLLQRSSVMRSLPPEFDDGYQSFLRAKGSWLLQTT